MSEELGRERLQAAAQKVVEALEVVVVGQGEAAQSLVIAYMSEGHALIEGVPGIGKTLLARSLASALGLDFSRIQFTPDLMPTDVIGTNVFDPASSAFRLVKGPLFTQLLMADEVNRTPPKTQSALLEAMQERQVTIDGVALALDPGFFVVATQNPVEFEGTYPLPEAQLDRFVMRIAMRLPDAKSEVEIYRQAAAGRLAEPRGGAFVPPVVSPDEARGLRAAHRLIHVAEDLLAYLARLAEAVRRSPHVELGVSPRAGLALLAVSRAAALLAGREFVLPDDIKRFLEFAWSHRIVLRAESELEGQSAEQVLAEAARTVPVPR